MKNFVYHLHIFFSRVAKFFSSEKHLHTARFASPHELKSLLSTLDEKAKNNLTALDKPTLLLGESIHNHVLKVSPTKTQKELANLLLVGRTRSGKSLYIVSQLLKWPYS